MGEPPENLPAYVGNPVLLEALGLSSELVFLGWAPDSVRAGRAGGRSRRRSSRSSRVISSNCVFRNSSTLQKGEFLNKQKEGEKEHTQETQDNMQALPKGIIYHEAFSS